jgi:iron(III) transport system permease protein
MCRFRGRSVFDWLLLLPLAVPAYILAYTYTDFLEYAGPVQGLLRDLFGWTSARDYWFPEIRSIEGAIAMFSLVLYPYVYMLARAAFLEQSVCALEVSRVLGRGPWGAFFGVALPLARPAIIAGLSLALMETLADFGTVQYFGVQTFVTGIYRVWYGMGERVAASQLAACLLGVIILLIALERLSRRSARFHHTTGRYRRLPKYRLYGPRAVLAFAACLAPVLLGFGVPALILLNLTFAAPDQLDHELWLNARHSLILAGLTAVLAITVALILAYGQRLSPDVLRRLAVRLGALGYAVPGAVIAIGVLLVFGWFDNRVDDWMQATFGLSTGLLISGTIAGLIFAYLVRFLAVSFNTIEASLAKITPTMDDAARSLGVGPRRTLFRVHMPMMTGSLFTAGILVFVDVMKELPATLILRPFNFDTLAIQTYQAASDERLYDASGAALAIVVAGIVPVIIVSIAIRRSRPGSKGHAAFWRFVTRP